MVKEYGMNEALGFVYYGESDGMDGAEMFGRREYSEKTAESIDAEIKSLIDALFARTYKMMVENREKIVAVAEALLRYETLTGDEVHALMRGETLDKPTISDLLDKEQHRGMTVGKARPVEPESKPGLDLGPGHGELPAPG
jgi:cell division protease FtsH